MEKQKKRQEPKQTQEPREGEHEGLGKPEKRSKRSRLSEYIVSIVVNLILLFVFNNLLKWHVPFLTRDFVVPLTILNISITATIAANLVFIFYDPAWFLAGIRAILNIIGAIFVYILYTTFPFDFSSLASEGLVTILVRVVLILGLVGTVVGTVVELTKFIRAIAKI
ncbi:MAG: hypothetical protein K6T91_01335 [Firmicutes bacterium]|nr:hypothetical protein [Bacillota bacterium]